MNRFRRFLLMLAFGTGWVGALTGCAATYTQQASNVSECPIGDQICMLRNPRGWVIDMPELGGLRKKLRLQWVLGGERDHLVVFKPDSTYHMTFYDDTPRHSSYRDVSNEERTTEGNYTFDANNMTIVGWDLVKNQGNEILVVKKLTPYSLWVEEINDPARLYKFNLRAITDREMVK